MNGPPKDAAPLTVKRRRSNPTRQPARSDPDSRQTSPDQNPRPYRHIWAAALELFTAACRIKGVLLPVATKVLHGKRPGWIPMIDNVILFAYLDALGRGGMKARTQEGAKAAGVGVFVMNAFRKDLEAADDEVDQVALALREAGTPMTPVRILEVALWMAIEPKGYYR